MAAVQFYYDVVCPYAAMAFLRQDAWGTTLGVPISQHPILLGGVLKGQELIDSDVLDVRNIGPLVAIIAVGVCIGFLPHNFNPARIMMGDGGALLLGLLLAVATSVVGGRADSFSKEFIGQTYFFLAPLAIPLLILGVPIVDTVFSFVRRVARGRSFSVADKDHLHHRLMRMGHGPRRTVVLLWTWTARAGTSVPALRP